VRFCHCYNKLREGRSAPVTVGWIGEPAIAAREPGRLKGESPQKVPYRLVLHHP